MNVLDYLLLAIVVFSVIPALIKGFVYEALMTGATIVGIWLALDRYRQLADALPGAISNPEARSFVAFLLILAGVLLAAMLIAKLLSGLIAAVGLRWFDRLLGAALGLVRGVLICTVLLIMMAAFPFDLGMMHRSLLAPDFLRAGNSLVDVMPSTVQSRFRQGLYQLKRMERRAAFPPSSPSAPARFEQQNHRSAL